ncbi:hypothetical protein R3P38DRAFT_3420783 [Favolaschia claudopus]|uniref:Uncharacterized protein n=1 Tax=Favolaschia claudopus TaxID=2862362 RepID=A0AAW0D5U6_9AGAR
MPSPLSRTPLTSRSIETDIGVDTSKLTRTFVVDYFNPGSLVHPPKSHRANSNTTIRDGWDSIAPMMAFVWYDDNRQRFRPSVPASSNVDVTSPLASARPLDTAAHRRKLGSSTPTLIPHRLFTPILVLEHASPSLDIRFVSSSRGVSAPFRRRRRTHSPRDYASRSSFLRVGRRASSSLPFWFPITLKYGISEAGGGRISELMENGRDEHSAFTMMVVCTSSLVAAGVGEGDVPMCRSACAGYIPSCRVRRRIHQAAPISFSYPSTLAPRCCPGVTYPPHCSHSLVEPWMRTPAHIRSSSRPTSAQLPRNTLDSSPRQRISVLPPSSGACVCPQCAPRLILPRCRRGYVVRQVELSRRSPLPQQSPDTTLTAWLDIHLPRAQSPSVNDIPLTQWLACGYASPRSSSALDASAAIIRIHVDDASAAPALPTHFLDILPRISLFDGAVGRGCARPSTSPSSSQRHLLSPSYPSRRITDTLRMTSPPVHSLALCSFLALAAFVVQMGIFPDAASITRNDF